MPDCLIGEAGREGEESIAYLPHRLRGRFNRREGLVTRLHHHVQPRAEILPQRAPLATFRALLRLRIAHVGRRVVARKLDAMRSEPPFVFAERAVPA